MTTSSDSVRDARYALLISAPLLLDWLANGFYLRHVKTVHWFLTIDVLSFVVGPLLVFALLIKSSNITLSSLGLGRISTTAISVLELEIVWLTILSLGIIWGSPKLLGDYLSNFDWLEKYGAPSAYTTFQGGWIGAIAILYYSASAAFSQELYFRSLLHLVIIRLVGWNAANVAYVVLSSVLFGACHWEGGLVKLLTTMTIGVLFSSYYLWRRSVWPLIAAHFLTDLTIGVIHLLKG